MKITYAVVLLGLLLVLVACGGAENDVGSADGANITATESSEPEIPSVSANADWTPVIQEFDGVEMAQVPAGCFMMGSEDGGDDELPVHEVCFDTPFWIDVYEVTNAQYGGPSTDPLCTSYSSTDDQPRICVNWNDAQAFCEGRGGNLPSEAQWEYAARGPSNWVYPWGDGFVRANVVHSGNSDRQTAAVGSRPGGVSWVGAYDMAGNASEWTTTIYHQEHYLYPYSFTDGRDDITIRDASDRVVRGGSFENSSNSLRGAYRHSSVSLIGHSSLSFRCVRADEVTPVISTDPQLTSTTSPVETSEANQSVGPSDVADADQATSSDTSQVEPVTANTDWTPVIQEFDGVQMALVPPGCFMMGSDEGIDNEAPAHEVCFDAPFWIDVYEVTNAQYGGPNIARYCYSASSADDQPRNCVTWHNAQAFCEGRGGSLPSEAQWEYAARGPSSWVYPWGDDLVEENAVYDMAPTEAVGSRPGGVSWVGAYDMAGNVWEWTTTIYDQDQYPYPYSFTDGRDDVDRPDVQGRVVRGGVYFDEVRYLRGAFRYSISPEGGYYLDGFRCVRSG